MDKNILKRFIPFAGLQDDYLEEAFALIDVGTYKKGHMLFKRGRKPEFLFFLIEGQVDLIDSLYMVTRIHAGSDAAKSALNADSPTQFSGVVKERDAIVFSVNIEALDRLVAWSQSAESAFETEQDEKNLSMDDGSTFIPGDSTFDVSEVSDAQATDWMSSLLQSPLFSKIPLANVQDLFTRFETVSMSQGEIVLKEGESGDYFYVLASGRAHITNRSDSADLTIEPGQYFGEEALLGETLRNATVTMLTSGTLKKLDKEAFASLLTKPILRYFKLSQLQALKQTHKLLDVKMPMEYRMAHVEGSINVPLPRLRKTLPELAKKHVYAIPDDAGSRADIAVYLLCQAGFEAVILNGETQIAEA